MKKRAFIKLSSAIVTGTIISPHIGWLGDDRLTNWAGNYTYSTSRLTSAKSVEQVKSLVQKYPKLKVLGTRHCFNNIADSKDNLISLGDMDPMMTIDSSAKTVSVAANVRYGQLATYLYSKGFALHNLASLPHISIAGACITATHGSGNKNGNLSTAVAAMEFVTAAGEVVTLSREKDGEQFKSAVVNLGGLGVLTKMTLDIEPAYQVRQDVYEGLSFDQLAHHFDEIMSAGYSVSLFTDWQKGSFSEVWIKRRVEEGTTLTLEPEFFGAKPATKNLHPIVELSAENCTPQMGVPGPWHERLPHFRMGFTPSSGKELQSEYFVPREHAYEAIRAVEKLHRQIGPHLMISEIRTIDADDLWMSPCYQQPSATIHFTWKQDWPEIKKLLPLIEQQLAPFNARPHWGKLFTISPKQLQSRYVKLPGFLELLKHYDPKGKFRNEFLNTNIYGV